MPMRLPGDPRPRFDLSHLRLIASVGEPLKSFGRNLGSADARTADSRQLVADGDRRYHDRQLPFDGDPAGIDG
jgi:hypothetical protein